MNREVFETGNVNGKRVNTILNLKEYQIASLARGRMNNEEIAEFMDLSVSSVKTYLSTVYTKLNVEGRKQLQTFLI
ncbi:MAG: helix-turn-helix transcriptional regulator [Eubacteriaceae bacterium]|jgi:DNA-binding CsgD family transcriptional regulator